MQHCAHVDQWPHKAQSSQVSCRTTRGLSTHDSEFSDVYRAYGHHLVSLCPYPIMSMMSLKFPELTLDLYVLIYLFKFVQILLGAFCFSTALNSCESRSMIWAWHVENIQRLSKASCFHFSSTSILDFHVNEEQKLQNTRLACLNVG